MAGNSTVSRRLVLPVWLVVAVGSVLLFGLAFALGRHRGEHRGSFEHYGRGGHPLVLLIVIALVVAAAVALARHFRQEPDPSTNAQSILAERFARGEIDGDEYARRKSALRE
jgi:putative membrane protein